MELSLGLVSPWDQRPRYSQPTAANLPKPGFWRERRKTYSEESQVVVMWLKAAVGNAYETRYERIRESGEWPANRLNVAKGQFAYLNFRLFFFFLWNWTVVGDVMLGYFDLSLVLVYSGQEKRAIARSRWRAAETLASESVSFTINCLSVEVFVNKLCSHLFFLPN